MHFDNKYQSETKNPHPCPTDRGGVSDPSRRTQISTRHAGCTR